MPGGPWYMKRLNDRSMERKRNKPGAGRKPIAPELKRVSAGIYLPRWFLDRLRQEKESMAEVIIAVVCVKKGWEPPGNESEK